MQHNYTTETFTKSLRSNKNHDALIKNLKITVKDENQP